MSIVKKTICDGCYKELKAVVDQYIVTVHHWPGPSQAVMKSEFHLCGTCIAYMVNRDQRGVEGFLGHHKKDA